MVNDSTDPSIEIEAPLDRVNAKTAERESTSVDLAEDLLGRTRTMTFAGETQATLGALLGDEKKSSKQNETPHECLETAKILYSEGLPDEAKRFCRRALILEPGFTPALNLLSTIHDRELERLLDGDASERSRETTRGSDAFAATGSGSFSRPRSEWGSPDEVFAQLDRDLKLGLLQETSLYKEGFLAPGDLERCLDGISVRDRLDMAIALLGMELWDAALVQLQAVQKGAAQGLTDEGILRSALALMAEAYLQLNNPYDAIAIVQPVLRDSDVANEEKLQFFYLMGRAHEALDQSDVASQWYAHILKTDENFRDAFDRHYKLGKPGRQK